MSISMVIKSVVFFLNDHSLLDDVHMNLNILNLVCWIISGIYFIVVTSFVCFSCCSSTIK